MAFLTGLFSVAENIKAPGGIPWEWLILQVFSFIENYGWRIVLFTVLLKLLLYPLDFYQRFKMRKNEKITQRLKPEMERLEKACAGNKQAFQQKQMELNKREGYSYFSACLPALLTMVIFIWLFSSLNNISQYMIMRQYVQWYDVYNAAYTEVIDGSDYENLTEDEKAQVTKQAEETGQNAVYDYYYGVEGNKESFLWIKNVWSPDVPWKKPIPEWSAFESAVAKWGTNENKLGVDKAVLDDMMSSSKYNTITAKLRTSPDNKTNGYLILPIIAVALSFLSQFITQRQQKKSGQANPMGGGSMKFMMILFPLMMVFFSLIYTAAFTLYIVLNSGMTIVLTLLSTAIFAIKDKAGEKAVTNTIIKYGRPDPNDIIKKK